MSVIDIPAFLLDLLQSVGAPVPLQHFGEAGCDCSRSDLENISAGREGTVEEPTAAVTCGMLAFRTHCNTRSWRASPGVIPGCFPWHLPERPSLAMLDLGTVSSESNTRNLSAFNGECHWETHHSLHSVKRMRNHRNAYGTCLSVVGSMRCPVLSLYRVLRWHLL